MPADNLNAMGTAKRQDAPGNEVLVTEQLQN